MSRKFLSPLTQLFVHSGLQSFVEAGGGIFVAGFLVSRGFSFPAALASFALILFSRLALRPLALPLALRFGVRSVLMIGIAIRAASFAMLPFVHEIGPLLVLFLAVSGLGSVLYWTAWHAFLPALTDNGRGGQQVSVQQATSALVGIVAPATGGLLLAHGGAGVAFAVITALQLASALPLLGAPNPAIDPDAELSREIAGRARRLYFNEGFHAGCSITIWNLALFASLGEHFDQFGAAMAAAGIAAAAGSLIVGRLIDGGRARHSLVVAYGLAALALAAKGLAVGHPIFAVVATALGALVVPMTSTAMLAPLYAMARQGPCLLRFSMASEGGWDMGCALASLTAAALLAAGAGFRLPILMGLAAIAAMAWMLDRWYAARPQAA